MTFFIQLWKQASLTISLLILCKSHSLIACKSRVSHKLCAEVDIDSSQSHRDHYTRVEDQNTKLF